MAQRQQQPKFRSVETNIGDAIDTGRSELESLRDEYQDWYDNLPESFQSGSKGDELQTAIDQLTEIVDEVEGLDLSGKCALPTCETLYQHKCTVTLPHRPKSKWVSRAMRGDDAHCYIECAKNVLEEARDSDERDESDEARPDYDALVDALDNAMDNINNVEWVTR